MHISAASAGLMGIHRATEGMNRAASQIVQKSFAEHSAGDFAKDFVALKQNQLLFEASGKVIQVANESAGRLIDILI